MDDAYCGLIYFFQKELGVTVDGNYSVARFQILVEEALKEVKEAEKNNKRK